MSDKATPDRPSCALPMYDLPELREHTDRLWTMIADRLLDAGLAAPGCLERPQTLDRHWRDPALLLSQSCGYPLLSLPPRVRVVATPCYRAEGCAGPAYRSALVVRQDDPADGLDALRGRRCAINGWDSNSGMNLLRARVAPLARNGRFFSSVVMSGSHLRSVAMVSEHVADLAAIDCVTLALARWYRPDSFAGLRILGWTDAAPGLPLITAGDDSVLAALRAALRAIELDPAARPVLDALLIARFEQLPRDAYDEIGALEQAAIRANYPVLC